MYKKIIYIELDTYGSIEKKELEKKALQYGVNIEFWCVGNLYYKNSPWKENKRRGKNSIFIKSWKALLMQIIRNTKSSTIYVFHVMGIGRRTYLIQAFIKLLGGKFICIGVSNGAGNMQKTKRLPLKSIYDYIKPEAVFISNKGGLYVLPSKRAIDRWNVIYTGTSNLSQYIEAEKNNNNVNVNYKYAVFCDENLAYHKEAEIQNQKWVENKEEYFLQCNRLFDLIERELGIEVIVALHPSTLTNEKETKYKAKVQVVGKTIELVKNAEIVILYASTSIDYAILYNKPVLFYTSEDIEKCNQQLAKGDVTRSYRRDLKAKYVYIDKLERYKNINEYFCYDKTKYEEYQNNYIMPSGVFEKYPDVVFEYVGSVK